MNIVKITNKIAIITVVLLMYWVFIFVSSMVFGFKVFQENMTEMFLLSILGIFAILSGAIILNITYSHVIMNTNSHASSSLLLNQKVFNLVAFNS